MKNMHFLIHKKKNPLILRQLLGLLRYYKLSEEGKVCSKLYSCFRNGECTSFNRYLNLQLLKSKQNDTEIKKDKSVGKNQVQKQIQVYLGVEVTREGSVICNIQTIQSSYDTWNWDNWLLARKQYELLFIISKSKFQLY